MNITTLAFSSALLVAAGIYGIILVTLTTDKQLWPPGEKTVAYYLHWSLVSIFNVSLLIVTYLDWNSWVLPRPSTLIGGIVLVVIGTAIFLRSASAMKSAETMGVTGNLYTEGPYAYSRNPQYVGMIIGLVGFALLVNSVWVTMLVAVHIGWVLLLPYAEEPHLQEEFGDEYERYRTRVPRFIGGHTVRIFVSDQST